MIDLRVQDLVVLLQETSKGLSVIPMVPFSAAEIIYMSWVNEI